MKHLVKFTIPLLQATMLLGFVAGYSLHANAARSKAVSVNCSKSTLQAAIDRASNDFETSITVIGTCRENVNVQRGRNIVLIGKSGASLVPKDDTLPVLSIDGAGVTIKSLNVLNARGAAGLLVEASSQSSLFIFGSILSAPRADVVVGYYGSSGSVINSKIVGGVTDTIEATAGSAVDIISDPSKIGGLNGIKTEIVGTSTGSGASCWMSSSLTLNARKSGASEGQIVISGASAGLFGRSCSIVTNNKTSSVNNIAIRNNVRGVNVTSASVFIRNTLVENNTQYGIWLRQTDLQLGGNVMRNNNVDISANFASDVMIISDWGINSLPDSTTSPYKSFSCYSGGRFDIESDGIAQNISGLYDPQCVHLY